MITELNPVTAVLTAVTPFFEKIQKKCNEILKNRTNQLESR